MTTCDDAKALLDRGRSMRACHPQHSEAFAPTGRLGQSFGSFVQLHTLKSTSLCERKEKGDVGLRGVTMGCGD